MVKIEIDDTKLNASIEDAIKKCNDLTIPFTLMVQSWYKSNRAIFDLSGKGKYTDLKQEYKFQKVKPPPFGVGFIYPILKRSGKLMDSITKPGSGNDINYIINKKSLILGSSVPYGQYHQFGTNKMPKRPWILIGSEQVAPKELNQRRDNWIKLLEDYVLKSAGAK